MEKISKPDTNDSLLNPYSSKCAIVVAGGEAVSSDYANRQAHCPRENQEPQKKEE
jgi:hypothetical protein